MKAAVLLLALMFATPVMAGGFHHDGGHGGQGGDASATASSKGTDAGDVAIGLLGGIVVVDLIRCAWTKARDGDGVSWIFCSPNNPKSESTSSIAPELPRNGYIDNRSVIESTYEVGRER